jgi:hypothetical protein
MVLQEYFNLKESAVYLGMSYRSIKNEYRSWEMFGIVPSRRPGKREVFYKKSDLDLLHEKTKIVQPNISRLQPRSFVAAAILILLLLGSPDCRAQIIQPAKIDLKKIAMIESSGNPRAWRREDDSRGLFQVTPICLKDYNNFHPGAAYSMDDLWDVSVSTLIADWYLNKRIPQMLRHFGIPDTIKNRLWAYNAGIGNVVKGRMPKITQDYLRKYFHERED